MFCNNCGKENKDGTKFCVQCGSMLRTVPEPQVTVQQTMSNAPQNGDEIVSEDVKKASMAALMIVLLAIAAVNILNVQLSTFSLSQKDELQKANAQSNIIETDNYIYYSGDAFYRLEKDSNRVTKLSSKYIIPKSAKGKNVYGFDSDGNFYKISEKKADLERVEGIEKYNGLQDIYFNGKRHYKVTSNGAVISSINSGKYSGYTSLICEGMNNWSVYKAKQYKNYIYMLLSEYNSEQRRLVRVSLRNGKKEYLTERKVSNFCFNGDKIVCHDTAGGFFTMNLNGKNSADYSEGGNVKSTSMICADGYVYYTDQNELHRFSVNGGSAETLGEAQYGLTEIDGGFAQEKGKSLVLVNYYGKENTIFSP